MALVLARVCGSHIGHQLAISIVLLSTVLFSPATAMPRPTASAQLPTQLLFNELLPYGPGIEGNTYYGEQLKYQQEDQQQQRQQQQHQPRQSATFNYIDNKWPSLRDLVMTADYDDDTVMPVDNNDLERVQLGSRLLSRLHRLSATDYGNAAATADAQLPPNMLADLTAMPAKKQSELMGSFTRQHKMKKNVQYMSPCHFKICNMGRKRNTDSYSSN